MSPPNDSAWIDESAWAIDPEADRLRNADFKTPKIDGPDYSTRGSDTTFDVAAEDARQDYAISPEQALWIAILLQAFRDAFFTGDTTLAKSAVNTIGRRQAGDAKISIGDAAQILRKQARAWLVSSLHHEDRAIVCALAGRDEKEIREIAKRLIGEAEKRERHAAILKAHIEAASRTANSNQKIEHTHGINNFT